MYQPCAVLGRDVITHHYIIGRFIGWQDLRKTAGLDVADRIELFVDASAGLKSAIEAHTDYITAETLTSNFVLGSPPDSAQVIEDEFDNEKMKVGLVKK